MVLDVRKNMCMASRTMEALCHCPDGFVLHGKKCVKDVGTPTIERRRRLLMGFRTFGQEGQEQKVAGEGRVGGARLVGSGGGTAIVKDVECRCPKTMMTAAQFKRRTSDSTIDEVEEQSDSIVHPGHGGCVMVEYHEPLKKCTDSIGTTTVDSDGNATPTNDCTNTVTVIADKYCKDEGSDGEKWIESCGGGSNRNRLSGNKRGFGFLVNDKNCWCEKKQTQAVHWICVRKGKLNIQKDGSGVVTTAVCEEE
eukprot:GHVS01085651.1.p1 GENE.GHVS01085651.1~~GHVS01085651.1.p1  ORF type:complete len:252 (+),score=55.69 GHVS01085651.1:440-1195(+)